MKKIIKFLGAFILITNSINASYHTDKTFFQPRSQGVNLAMEYTTWDELLMTKGEDRFGANFQVVPFYQESADDSRLGRYFGLKNKKEFVIGSMTKECVDLDSRFIIHNVHNVNNKIVSFKDAKATLKLDPKTISYGARIDYYQDLEKLLKGLYLKVAIPVVHVQNDMHFKIEDKDLVEEGVFNKENIYKYFKGDYSVEYKQGDDTNNFNAQKALTNAKMHGKENKTGVADIDILVGYKFLDRKKYHASLNVGLTIPVGNNSDGFWVFEPMVGNGDAWGIGFGLDSAARLWRKEEQNIKAVFAFNYRYFFKHNQVRTLGLEGYDWAQYYLVAKNLDTQLMPLANLLTRRVRVDVGGQFDGILALAYNYSGFNVELGYNLFWRDGEEVKIKDSLPNNVYALVHPDKAFVDESGDSDTYHIMDKDMAMWSDGYVGDDAVVFDEAVIIKNSLINRGSAQTPFQVTNKIYAGLGYIVKDVQYPVFLGLGGSYEFVYNSGIENWACWGKFGVAF